MYWMVPSRGGLWWATYDLNRKPAVWPGSPGCGVASSGIGADQRSASQTRVYSSAQAALTATEAPVGRRYHLVPLRSTRKVAFDRVRKCWLPPSTGFSVSGPRQVMLEIRPTCFPIPTGENRPVVEKLDHDLSIVDQETVDLLYAYLSGVLSVGNAFRRPGNPKFSS